MSFVPSGEYLERYARLLVDYALGEDGAGIARGDVVQVVGGESSKPLYAEICRAVWRSGGHVLHRFQPPEEPGLNLNRDFFELAGEAQLDFFPEPYSRGLLDQSDHLVALLSEADPHGLRDIDPTRIMRRRQAFQPAIGWQQAKEAEGRFTWTAALYGTEAMASEAGLSIEEYWEQIVAACYLDDPDLLDRWREVNQQIEAHCAALNVLPANRLHVEGEDADLWLTLGGKRKWLGGGGRNIPSFEVFTTPDWRGTQGWIRFTEPLYVFGSLIKGIELEFQDGRVTASRAGENEKLLREMIATPGADRVGEFSLTDARLSRITKFMASTLYDENVGGRYGNTHLALGLGLRHAYDGDPAALSEEEWERLGFNASSVHTDIVSTSDRTVTAVLKDGSEQIIYADGRFQHD
ncbi:MAG TPA: aminopeptidase [Solirubrobacteraceae bacterium]|jgi:aminopeptidase|nr:aminopeptidase [Solirubrobacteraceae bacterium]